MLATIKRITCCLAATLVLAAATCMAAEGEAASVDRAAVDKAFGALATFDWGQDIGGLMPIEAATFASKDDAALAKDLETRLAAVLTGDAKRGAKDYACRMISLIGTAKSVPALAPLLLDDDLSHMARYALERMSCDEATAAMRDALPKTKGVSQLGILQSLGIRRDAESVALIVPLLEDADSKVVAAAAAALGAIGNTEAADALGAFLKTAPEEVKLSVADAYLLCAERLLASGDKTKAIAIYLTLAGAGQPQQIRVAAARGRLAAATAKD